MVKLAGVASCILLLVATVSIVLGRSGGRNAGHPCRYLTLTNTRTNLKQIQIQRQGRNAGPPCRYLTLTSQDRNWPVWHWLQMTNQKDKDKYKYFYKDTYKDKYDEKYKDQYKAKTHWHLDCNWPFLVLVAGVRGTCVLKSAPSCSQDNNSGNSGIPTFIYCRFNLTSFNSIVTPGKGVESGRSQSSTGEEMETPGLRQWWEWDRATLLTAIDMKTSKAPGAGEGGGRSRETASAKSKEATRKANAATKEPGKEIQIELAFVLAANKLLCLNMFCTGWSSDKSLFDMYSRARWI